MKPLKVAVCAAIFAVLSMPALAQDTSSSSPPPEQVTVTGHAEDMVRDFVGQVSAAPAGADQLARWDRSICPQVAGIQARYAQFIIDRISERAYQLGLTPGHAGCRANIFIFVTPDSQTFAKALVDHQALMATHTMDENGNSRGQAALSDFANTDRPVRWWHVTQSVAANGQVLGNGDANVSGPMAHEVVNLPAGQASRLTPTTRQDFNRVLIVVDATKSQGLAFGSLADYLAMVALAQLDPAADTSPYDTILNLFRTRNAGGGPTELTSWDESYLQGLYGAPRFARSARQQAGSITRHMRGDISQPGPSER